MSPMIPGVSGASNNHQPGTPTIGTAVAGNTQATVAYTAPANLGKPTGTTYRALTQPVTIRSTTGTIANVVQIGSIFRADITGMSATTNLYVNQVITATAGTGSLGAGVVTISAITSASTIIVESTATMTAGTITNILGGITSTGTTSPVTVTGLTNGTSYNFRINLGNGVGTSLTTGVSNSVTPVAPFGFFSFAPPFGFTPPFTFTPPVFSFTPPVFSFFSFTPPTCVQGDTLVRTVSGYVKARDLFIGQKLASYKFNELPDNSSVEFAETWTSDTLSGDEVVETSIKAIKAREVAITVMFNGNKQRRFSLEHLMLVRRDDVYLFVQAGVIKLGDYLVYDIDNRATDVLVETVGYLDEMTDVYDISVYPYSLFIAGDLISHNKKGYFQGPTRRDSI